MRSPSIIPLVLLAGLWVGCELPSRAQEVEPTLSARLTEMLGRLSNGHSPTPEETAAVQTLSPMPDAAAVRAALPAIEAALTNHDRDMQAYALTILTALEVSGSTPDGKAPAPNQQSAAVAQQTASQPPATNQPQAPAAFPREIAQVLAPEIPKIAAHLTDDVQANRILTTVVLGGFSADPPPAIFAPLLAYLKRDDGIGPTGAEVVSDLLILGPISTQTADAIASYLRRTDQSAEARSTLVDAIASKPLQNQWIDKTLLSYLRSDDNSLRARVILSLPQLDLPAEDFADTKAMIAAYAALDPASGQENLQVINAAKSVAPCWTQVKMTSGCPVY
jgi:hypothetical protein